jgi:hypothetical protein
MQNFVMTQEELDAFNKPIIESAKKVHAQNPHVPWLRTSAEIKLDIFRLTGEKSKSPEGYEGLLPRFKRQLDAQHTAEVELKEALARTEKTIDELKKMGAGPRNQRLLELLGYDYFSKTYQCMQHRTGVLDQIREQLGALELRIESLEAAVENTEARVKRELPKLEAELKEAVKREKLL